MKRFVPLAAAIAVGLLAPSAALAQKGVVEAARRAAMEAQQGQGRGRPNDRRDDRVPDERSRPEREPPRQQAPPPRRRITEGQAIAAVQRVAGRGHHLDVFAGERGGRPVYTVRWASDSGQRRDYTVDAETGVVR